MFLHKVQKKGHLPLSYKKEELNTTRKKKGKNQDGGALETRSFAVVGPSAINRTTGAAGPSGAGWMMTSSSGSFTSSSTIWTESSVSSLTASFPPEVGRMVLSMAIQDKSRFRQTTATYFKQSSKPFAIKDAALIKKRLGDSKRLHSINFGFVHLLVKSGQLYHQVGICLLYLLTMTSLLLKKGKLGHQLHVMSMDGLLVLIPLLVLYFLTFMESWDQPFVGYTSVLKGPHLYQRLKKKNTVRISTQELCTKSDGVQVCLLDDRIGHLNGVVFVGDQPLDEVKDDKALPHYQALSCPMTRGRRGLPLLIPN